MKKGMGGFIVGNWVIMCRVVCWGMYGIMYSEMCGKWKGCRMNKCEVCVFIKLCGVLWFVIELL